MQNPEGSKALETNGGPFRAQHASCLSDWRLRRAGIRNGGFSGCVYEKCVSYNDAVKVERRGRETPTPRKVTQPQSERAQATCAGLPKPTQPG